MDITQDASQEFQLEDTRHDLPLQLHYELDDLGLTLGAFRVYAHLVRRAGRDGRVFPSYRTIAQKCFSADFPNAQVDTLDRKAKAAMKELRERGLVLVIPQRREDGGQATNLYRLTPRVHWHPPGVMAPPRVSTHPPGVTAPKVNQVQANQDSKEKDGAENRARPKTAHPESQHGRTDLPPVSQKRETAGKATGLTHTTTTEDVPGGAALPVAIAIPDTLRGLQGFTEAWGEWVAYRKARQLSCLPVSLNKQLAFLAAQPDPVAVIEQSITQAYAGLFPLKGVSKAGRPRNQAEANEQFIQGVNEKRAAVAGVFDD